MVALSRMWMIPGMQEAAPAILGISAKSACRRVIKHARLRICS